MKSMTSYTLVIRLRLVALKKAGLYTRDENPSYLLVTCTWIKLVFILKFYLNDCRVLLNFNYFWSSKWTSFMSECNLRTFRVYSKFNHSCSLTECTFKIGRWLQIFNRLGLVQLLESYSMIFSQCTHIILETCI